jgi:hypothetical protein
MGLKKDRERRIGLVDFRQVPMTSRKHPQGGLTYHIIRLENPDRPGIYAELLICDQNQYLLAFRRRVGNVWSDWFYFKDQEKNMPAYLRKTALNFGGRHTTTTTIPTGEITAFLDIYHVLIDPASTDVALRRALLRAIILFCEATRIECVLEDMEGKMLYTVQQALAGLLWKRIRKWKKMSNYGLHQRNKVLVQGGDGVEEVQPGQLDAEEEEEDEDALEAELLGYLEECEIYNLDQAIGPQGQLRLILLNDEHYQHYGQVLQFPGNYQDNFRGGLV